MGWRFRAGGRLLHRLSAGPGFLQAVLHCSCLRSASRCGGSPEVTFPSIYLVLFLEPAFPWICLVLLKVWEAVWCSEVAGAVVLLKSVFHAIYRLLGADWKSRLVREAEGLIFDQSFFNQVNTESGKRVCELFTSRERMHDRMMLWEYFCRQAGA